MQKPHPPCYIVGTGSPETIEIAAELGFGYSSVFVPSSAPRAQPEAAAGRRRLRPPIRPDQVPLQAIVYVAETEEKAEEDVDAHPLFLRGRVRTTPR